MQYIPNTDPDRKEMLSLTGKGSIDELFADIPKALKAGELKDIPEASSESELKRTLKGLSEKNSPTNKSVSFLGAGSYNHFIPSIVDHIVSRSEFYTAYTPYQPEISQGMLQAIFEYQSMICSLTGMDVANASMYDGATALAEAISLAISHTGRKKVLISKTVHPNYRQVVNTYANGAAWEIFEVGYRKDGISDLEKFKAQVDDKTACIVISNPNFFGCLEDIKSFSEAAKAKGTLLIVSIDPVSLGILKRPGDLGVDIVVGEGQSLGLSQNFGGPYLGIFAVKKDLMRLVPGRIVGETVDKEGKRGYVLTLQAREQHIRRERAGSNICSNEALCALAATVYLSTMGKQGLKEVADQCLQKANYAKEKLSKLVAFKAPTFKEFVIKLPGSVDKVNKKLLKNGIIGGLDLGKYYPELKNHMLIAVTEMVKKEDIDNFMKLLNPASRS
ncbi:aminomethyl-transferring glycine dehydrogenase subunit GcvPA [Candidatus Margulisiibacteriota bacterium]